MRVLVGTSGYSYKEWKGTFYPEDLGAAGMLRYYAERFSTVEINNTFYRMPEEKTLIRWAGEVPEGFTFVLKAPQRITHQKKLSGAGDDVRHFLETAAVLGPKLGPVLFQLPPFARKDTARLRDFLTLIPRTQPVALEFRHASWSDEEVYAVLRDHNAALCAADTDEVEHPDSLIVPTADWGYVRLRRTQYASGGIAAWSERITGQPWSAAYVFFKHEDEGKGPLFARSFLDTLPH